MVAVLTILRFDITVPIIFITSSHYNMRRAYKSIGCIKLPKSTKTFEEQVTDFDKCCFVLVYRSSVSQDGVAINVSTLKPFR